MKIDVFMMGLRHIHATEGGIETHVRHLASELALQGLNIAVAVRRRAHMRDRPPTPQDTAVSTPLQQSATGDRNPCPIRIIPIWSPRIFALEAILHSLFCVLYAAIMRPRIVHIHAIGPSLVAPIARCLGLRVVATHHGQDYEREKWGPVARAVLRLGEKTQATFANEIICVSQSLSETLRRRYHRNYIYVPNGVPAAKQPSSPHLLEKFALRPNGYILAVGRLVPEKRHCELIDAFVAAKIHNVKLVIVGTGTPKFTDRLVRKAKGVPDIVLAGFQDGENLDALYAHALVFALPSSHEGLPIALLEAMAHGCEVVVSDIAPHREFGFSNGRYHAVGDVPALSARMRNVALRAVLKSDRCDWTAVLNHYRWPSIARQTLDVFRSVDPLLGREAPGTQGVTAIQTEVLQRGQTGAAAIHSPGKQPEIQNLSLLS